MMKSALIFKKNGEIEETSILGGSFNIDNFEFVNHDMYNKYCILYNTNDNVVNITLFPFTPKKYFGDILLIKLDKNNKIKHLSIPDYDKILSRIKEKINDTIYTSSDDSEFI